MNWVRLALILATFGCLLVYLTRAREARVHADTGDMTAAWRRQCEATGWAVLAAFAAFMIQVVNVAAEVWSW